jgi:hypothetical protein
METVCPPENDTNFFHYYNGIRIEKKKPEYYINFASIAGTLTYNDSS